MKICGHRLLIVEDEPLLRITMADALRNEGWMVDVAEDGVKGAALFEQHVHDLVLTDLVMPQLTARWTVQSRRCAKAPQISSPNRFQWLSLSCA
jgi:DNA-binding response OmpR family regulator